MEMGYLFLESEEEKKHLLNENMNHIGLGVDWDAEKIIIVMVILNRPLAITRISDKGDVIEIKGKMVNNLFFLLLIYFLVGLYSRFVCCCC